MKIQHTSFADIAIAAFLLIDGLPAYAASIVKATYSHKDEKVALMIYTGSDGGPNSNRTDYWKLLGKAPQSAYEVMINPDEPGGKVATFAGDITISVEIRNQFSMGMVKTDKLTLVRDDADSTRWYIPAKELSRIVALIADGVGSTTQSPPATNPTVVWESPKTSVPEIKLVVSIWPEAKQLTHPHDSLGRYWYSIDIGFPQANDKELFRKFDQGLADLGWEPISTSTPNTKYKKGKMHLQVSLDTGRHPTTLMLSFEPAGKDTEPPAGGDGKPTPQP